MRLAVRQLIAPGPWQYHGYGAHDAPVRGSVDLHHRVTDQYGRLVVGPEGIEGGAANAMLIAEAPSMLEVLHSLVNRPDISVEATREDAKAILERLHVQWDRWQEEDDKEYFDG